MQPEAPEGRDRAALEDMLREARSAVAFVNGWTYSDFSSDERTQHAVLHCLMIVGEASKRLSARFRDTHPMVRWRSIAGMRDVFVHVYHRVELAEVWNILERDLPELIRFLERELHSEDVG